MLFVLAMVWDPYPGDLLFARWVQELKAPGLLPSMKFLSLAGEEVPMVALNLIVVAALWIAGMRKAAVAGILVLLSAATNPLMKLIVDRERPEADMLIRATEDFSGLGFPSGHAFQSAILFGFLIYLSSMLIKRLWLRRTIQALLAFLIFAMGFSRVYVGAHWPSDVLGSLVAAVPVWLIIYLYHDNAVDFASRLMTGRPPKT